MMVTYRQSGKDPIAKRAPRKADVMSLSKHLKKVARQLKISWREDPSRYEIEALHANIERVGLVIKIRWLFVAALGVYSLFGAWAYARQVPLEDIAHNLATPVAAMVFMMSYNTFYQLTYRRLGNIAILNHAQLMFDAMVVAVLVYYSGGVHSAFWAMYMLFVLEAAFILPKRWQTWAMAAFCLLLNGIVIWGVYARLLPDISVPFVPGDLHQNFTFVFVTYLWQATVLFGTASVSTMMMSALKVRQEDLAKSSIIDSKTGLHDRAHFNQALASELFRAEKDSRNVALIFIDIDDFAGFNRALGFAHGDRLLLAVSGAIRETIQDCSAIPGGETNLVARYGGEEFAILLVQDSQCNPPTLEYVAGVAESVRCTIEKVKVEDAGVTVSIGAVSTQTEGWVAQDLLAAADNAVQESLSAGGNRVRVVGWQQ